MRHSVTQRLPCERLLLLAAVLCLASACATRRGRVHAELLGAAERANALEVSDALEALIASGRDTPADREYAHDVVQRHEEDTAAYTYARAAVTGRLVQLRGLRAARLVPEIERFARRSRELDPVFRNGAAIRLLGTLYVMAPAWLLEHGDSEQGLELLEGLTTAHPDVLENHLRLAEAYITLGDPDSAGPHLCRCLAQRSALRADEQILLGELVATTGMPRCNDPPSRGLTRVPACPRPVPPGRRSTAPPAAP